MDRPANIIREESVEWREISRGRSRFRCRGLASAAGGRELGCTLYEVPPGGRTWPYHYHFANEEAIYVLAGSGTLRLPGGEAPIAAGDYVALPRGPEAAHQVVNTSEGTLRFLCLSTMNEPEIAVYPESKKLGLFAGSAPGGPPEVRDLRAFLPRGPEVDYWEGES